MPSIHQDTESTPNHGPNGAVRSSPISHNSQKKNTWAEAGPAAFDFRSDVVTTPTAAMLDAIAHTSLLDDVFQEDETTNDLQKFIARLTGHEDALLVTSGTMGNQLSIRTHLKQPPYSVVADSRSHIMQWEAGGLAFISSAMAYPTPPSNSTHLTLADILPHAVTSTDIHACPTQLICLENTLGGSILPLATCQEISNWARAQSPPIAMHCDGARLWEAVAAGAGSLEAYCACFDSVSLCFSKGLGAPIGSMIVGSRAFIGRARHFRKAMGGGLRQSGVVSAPAMVAVEETFLKAGLDGARERARRIAGEWVRRGGRLGRGVETNMVWLDLGASGVSEGEFVEAGVREGVKVLGGRLVVHYQVGDEGERRLGRVFDAVLGGTSNERGQNGQLQNGASHNGGAVDVEKEDVEKEVKRKAEEVMAPKREYGVSRAEGSGAL